MYLDRKQAVIMLTLAALVGSIAGCGGSREVQCIRLLEVIDRGTDLVGTQNSQYDAATTQKLSQELNGVADELEELYLTKGKLKKIRRGFSEVFRNLSLTLDQMGQALAAAEATPISVEGRTQLQQAIDKVKQVSEPGSQISEEAKSLTAEMKKYCPPEALNPLAEKQ